MIISMIHRATSEQVEYVCDKIKSFGYAAHPIRGKERVVIGAVGDGKDKDRIISVMESVPGVESVIPIMQPFKLVGSELKQERTVIRMDGFTIGGDQFVVMAGPCSVEYREQLMQTADSVKAAGAKILRGGAYKPRTSPYDFQGLEEEGLKLLAEARERTGLKIITEVVNTENVDLVNEYTDIFQVGARNMQNFALLKRLGRTRKPVLLKRGMMSTLKEFLMSAEYIVSQGNTDVILCERGIRTFETYTRNTLDISAVPALQQLSHLPVVVDPSHGTGKRNLIAPVSNAAVAVGGGGLLGGVAPPPGGGGGGRPPSLMAGD
ncbi:MAG: 3-deoxy-7-phosphoheptulonate synthase, partial [Acidobacteria bacterium]|nr:3-deoxy-7-phosphoheptulonate synthase [Acidobacteriota bacterium]